MKSRTLLAFVALASIVVAAQDPIQLIRTFKEGDKDTFKLSVTAMLPIGSADINMVMSQTVKKVYENGDADIETKVSEMRMAFNGSEMPMPAGADAPATVQRMDKFGRPVGAETGGAGNGMMQQMNFLRYAGFFGEKPVTIGGSIEVEQKDEKAGTRTWGNVTFSKVENGIATVVSDLKMTTKQTGDKPMVMKFVSLVRTEDGKIDKIDGEITQLPANEQGMTVDSVKIQMERVK